MGLSVWNQVDTDKYFSLSTIDKKKMEKHGVNMSIAKLREIARRTLPIVEVATGHSSAFGPRRRTKIYRYADFANVDGGENMK